MCHHTSHTPDEAGWLGRGHLACGRMLGRGGRAEGCTEGAKEGAGGGRGGHLQVGGAMPYNLIRHKSVHGWRCPGEMQRGRGRWLDFGVVCYTCTRALLTQGYEAGIAQAIGIYCTGAGRMKASCCTSALVCMAGSASSGIA
jgi:hypothetical protein